MSDTARMLNRPAGSDDVEAVADFRLRFLAEHRGVEPTSLPSDFRNTTFDYLRQHDAAGTSRSWLAEHDGSVVGVVTMLLLDLPPRPQDRSGREGYIVNMYVTPEHRGRGVGRSLLDECLTAARDLSLRRLLLYATDDGRPLYASVGFDSNTRWMELPM